MVRTPAATALASALATRTHDHVEVGAPFWAESPAPGQEGLPPTLHKFDHTEFVPAFLSEASAAAQGGGLPPSMLGPIDRNPKVLDVDTDALDFFGARFRKAYLPTHFRFYLAACQLRCRVPGFPAPERKKVKKVEMVIRRVAIDRPPASSGGGLPTAASDEWAWVPVPDPGVFPDAADSPDPAIAGAPPIARELAPRLTGNTHTWWPVPPGVAAPEGEQRFPMSWAMAPGVKDRGVYFGFLPLASGDMYGPPIQIDPKTVSNGSNPPLPGPAGDPDAPDPPPQRIVKFQPAAPLVPAPSNFALSVATMKNFLGMWRSVLGRFTGAAVTGPRPKFESPRLNDDTDDGARVAGCWGYVVRCVATIEVRPGCLVESWGAPTDPMLVASHFDPFAGRPTQVEIPSPRALAQMLGTLSAQQIAQRGGNQFGVRRAGCGFPLPVKDLTSAPGTACFNEICFFGLPVFTICAYFFLSIALLILFPVLAIFLALQFCIPIPKSS